MEEEKKLVMIKAASSALDYLNKKPDADSEQVLKHVMKNINACGDVKIAAIAAANHVAKLKEHAPKTTQKQAMQSLADNTKSILNSIKKQTQAHESQKMQDM